MRVILYKRVSTDEQADRGFSLTYQNDVLRDFCKRHNYEIVGDFIDDASGKNFERPEYKKMYSQLKAGTLKADLILCLKWNRFGRSCEHCLREKRQLNEMGVAVNTVLEWIEMKGNNNAIIMLSLFLAQGESDRNTIISQTTAGTHTARMAGYHTGVAPYGYRNIRDSFGKPTLEILEEEAKYVRIAFVEVAKGIESANSIFDKLKKEGMKITKQTFYRMFHNPTYCGQIYVFPYLDKPGCVVDGKHLGIISVEIFMQAQFNKTNNRWQGIVPKAEVPEFPLRNYLICPCCNGNLTASTSKGRNQKYQYYHCRNKCSFRVSREEVDKFFLDLLEQLTVRKEYADLLNDALSETIIEQEGDSKKEQRSLSNSIEHAEKQLAELDMQLASGKLPLERYNRISQSLEERIKKDKSRLVDLSSRKSFSKENLKKTVWILSNLKKLFEEADFQGKRKFLAAMFPEKLILEKDKCRTTEQNKMLALVASIINGMEQKKSGKKLEKSNIYRSVPGAGLEPAQALLPEGF